MKKWQVVLEVEDASGALVYEIEANSAEEAGRAVRTGLRTGDGGECIFSKVHSEMSYGIFSCSVYEAVQEKEEVS